MLARVVRSSGCLGVSQQGTVAGAPGSDPGRAQRRGWKTGRGTLTSKRAREPGARGRGWGREPIARRLLPAGQAERTEGAAER